MSKFSDEEKILAAVKCLTGEDNERSINLSNWGYRQGAAKVENNLISLWIEECYIANTFQYEIGEDGVCKQVSPTNAEGDYDKKLPDESFNLSIKGLQHPRLNELTDTSLK